MKRQLATGVMSSSVAYPSNTVSFPKLGLERI